MSFKDHFSRQSSDYSRYRPHYPEALFRYLASMINDRRLAWDCATGNGQAAVALAPLFQRVIASDPSQQQIDHSIPHEKIRYIVAAAENSGLESDSVDLITVAQALHWFDLEKFYAEARRVLRPGGMLAVWCYGLTRISPLVDAVIGRFYNDIVGSFWPPERILVEQGYRALPFPFAEQKSPPFQMEASWTMEHLMNYLGTWSAVQRYREHQHRDPLAMIRNELTEAWGGPATVLPVRWPISLRLGYHR